MKTDIDHVHSAPPAPIAAPIVRAGYFLLHYLEMCIVMCAAGLAALSALLRWASPLLGFSSLKAQLPELTTLLLAVWLTAVMILWMRFRGHDWRSTLEMASTSVVSFPLLIGAASLGLIARGELFGLECGLACVFMVVPMLLRLDHYAGPHAAHVHDEHAAHQHHA